MVVVRRRSDGLYYNHIWPDEKWRKRGENQWLQLDEVMPLKNERAARQILTPYIYDEFRCECPYPKGRYYRGQKDCEHNRARIAEQKRRFDEAYEIVPVRLEIIDGI
jgi:hypothetical protein